jgi:hypothetical protein
MLSNQVKYADGGCHYTRYGKHHREDGPAWVLKTGTLFWYQYGKRHRDDGPSAILSNGDKFWHKRDIRVDYVKYRN